MKQASLQEISRDIQKKVQQKGIKDLRIVARKERSRSISFRNGELEDVKETTSCNLSLHLYDKGKYACCNLNDFRPQAVDPFLAKAASILGAMESDKHRELTHQGLYQNREERDLRLFDPQLSEINADRLKGLAQAGCKAVSDSVNSAKTLKAASCEAYSKQFDKEVFRLHSNGFEGLHRESVLSITTAVVLEDREGQRPNEYSLTKKHNLNDIPNLKALGQDAVRRCSQRLGSSKTETFQCPMLIENRVASHLLGSLVNAFQGRNIQQHNSFLSDSEGKTIASPLLTLKDEPFIPEGWGSRLFDPDGISARPFYLTREGVLENYLIDYYYGKKMDRKPTSGWYSNLVLPPGTKSLKEMIKDIPKGILVQGFLGGNCNVNTGDFSYGIYGQLIEKGEITRPVSEMNISGNHKDLWQRLSALGSDPWEYNTLVAPSLLFDSIQFSGA